MGRFSSYHDLAENFSRRCHYDVQTTVGSSGVLVAAIHGGNIETGTSEIASLAAGRAHGLYLFEGYLPLDRYEDLHVTSWRFDEPCFAEMVKNFEEVITIHGCRDRPEFGAAILIGGRNERLKSRLAESFGRQGIANFLSGHRYTALSTRNVCNRGKKGWGVQLEISQSLRDDRYARGAIARSIDVALSE